MSSRSERPALQIPTNRAMWKMVLLGILTLGIYPLAITSAMSENINAIVSRYDGKKTMHYCLLFFLVGPFTLGIGFLVWYHRFSRRIGRELDRRDIDYSSGAGSFWGWNILGCHILVGPLVYLHKLCKSMNLLAWDYNARG